MRKLKIGLIAFGAVALAFIVYVSITDNNTMKAPEVSGSQDLDMPETKGGIKQTGDDTRIIETLRPKYTVLDPVTKEVTRILGFEKLLNPNMETSRWSVEKPYMIFYNSKYECRVDSDTGTFQVDSTGSDISPKDARLFGNVKIHITPRKGSSLSETFISMDDLVFSSERSEIATDGPIQVESDQVWLDGYGLILLFNSVTEQIDYLHIRDLKELRLFGMADSGSPAEEQAQISDDKESDSQIQPHVSATHADTPAQSSGTAQSSEQDTAVTQGQSEADSEMYYQCILEDDVTIEYGDELIVAGADQVTIHNVVLSGSQQTPLKKEKNVAEEKPDTLTAQTPASSIIEEQISPTENNTAVQAKDTVSTADSNKDVVVKCEGGIILKPMVDSVEEAVSLGPDLLVEMSGSPLKIDQLPLQQNDEGSYVRCGHLKYQPSADVLKLFTRPEQPQIILNAQESGSRIHTYGDILWNRKDQHANIEGPGRVYLSNSESSDEPSEVMFNGEMDLLFAKADEASSDLAIQVVNLTGGMNAILKQDGWYKTIADSATVEFGQDNMLSQAQLFGDVRFESMRQEDPQNAVANTARFDFGPENALAAVHMDGDVHFESIKNQKQSSAAAESASFYFEQNKIHLADFRRAVSFVSDSGKLTSNNATIEFKPDAEGQMQPEKVHTHSNTVLETIPAASASQPAKFEARKIDYDLLTGSGLAHGPVRFTFYQTDGAKPNTQIPVTVTADKNAMFIAGQDRNIRQVVFNRNVLAVRRNETDGIVQLDTCHGDTLTVSLDDNPEGQTDINEIRIADGDVYAESRKIKGEEKLSHVKLYCNEIIFDQTDNDISAVGPGKIEMDNSHVSTQVSADGSGLDLRRSCYVFCEGFSLIHWDLDMQKIVAEGLHEVMQIAYIPLKNGAPEKYIFVNSSRFDLNFDSDPFGKTILDRLFTDEGIVYIEENYDRSKTLHRIIGQTMEYQRQGTDSWIRIEGTPSVPVNVDGSRLPRVFVNPETGEMKAALSTLPGVLNP